MDITSIFVYWFYSTLYTASYMRESSNASTFLKESKYLLIGLIIGWAWFPMTLGERHGKK